MARKSADGDWSPRRREADRRGRVDRRLHAATFRRRSRASISPSHCSQEFTPATSIACRSTSCSHGSCEPNAHGSVLRALTRRERPRVATARLCRFPTGIGELTDALDRGAGPLAIRCNASGCSDRGRRTHFASRSRAATRLEARAIVVATPAWSAARMLATARCQALARLCASIRYASSATAVFALRREQVRHPLDGHGYVVPCRERRALMAATWVSSKWPHRAPAEQRAASRVRRRAPDPGILEQARRRRSQPAAFADLATLLGIIGEPELTRVYRWPRANAQYNVGHLATCARSTAGSSSSRASF